LVRARIMRQTVILVPGLLCDAAVWAHQVNGLGEHYDVLVPDLRDFDSIEAMARHVLAEAPARFSVAGHSMGARVALEMVRLEGERVERLALLDTGIHAVKPGEPERRQVLIDLGESRGMAALADAWLPPMVQDGRLERDPALNATLHAMVERMTPAVHCNHITALLRRPDARVALPAVRCPVLVGVGSDDRWSPPSQHEEIVAALPVAARYIVFEGSGHMAPLEAPEAVTEALLSWMAMPVINNGPSAGMTPDVPLDRVSLARFAAEHAVARQIHRFAKFNDAHDHDALAAMFTADGSFARPTQPDSPICGREVIRVFFRDRPARRTRHVMTNVVVDLTGATTARAHSYVLLYSGAEGQDFMVGAFNDELVLEDDGEWRFRSRRGLLAFV
jgi:pimeloyl-ACP methyl ester carboxylesterase